jgi:hypothetical protein
MPLFIGQPQQMALGVAGDDAAAERLAGRSHADNGLAADGGGRPVQTEGQLIC